ncbi:MAG: zinc-dependent metalloprotease [Pyrinomonadaceae bacterium]|nr:zinc-dependent metalloprotease [Pyrinomonadaceae bacterium]
MKNNSIVRSMLFGAVAGLFAINAAYGGSRELFRLTERPSAKAADERSSVASVRESEIAVDDALLPVSATFVLPVFNGKSYTAVRSDSEGFERRGAGNITWRGKIASGDFRGDVVITQIEKSFSALIYTPEAVYEIVPKGSRHYLVELDQRLFPPCAGEVAGERFASVSRPGVAGDSGDRIDVLVLYTAAVRTSAGGDAQAKTIAQQAIDATNTAYINSKIRQRVRLVGAEFTNLTETGDFSSELSNLRGDAAANARRDELNADLVDMLTNSTAACGIGYLMGPLGGNPGNGFTVTARTCAVGNLSFAHELGHNMGSHHNPENGGTAAYPYGYGHYVNGKFRTVMSYSNPCTLGCTRVAYFSNPMINYMDLPTGIDNQRDNARSINNTADWIANYRYSGAGITLTNFDGNVQIPRLIEQELKWTSNNISGDVRIDISRDEASTWDVLVPSTPNDGSERVRIGGRATKRARIRVVSISSPAVSDSSVSNIILK